MAEFNTDEILSADNAYWISTTETPLNDQSTIKRKWSKITKRALAECRVALIAVDSYTSPKAGNKTIAGTWRNSDVDVVEGKDFGEIVQTLKYGFASSELPTAQVVQGEHLETTPFFDDIVDKYDRAYRYRGVDPSKYDTLKPTLGTTTDGYRTVRVEHRENDDGSIDIYELRRKFTVASQTVTSGAATKRIASGNPSFVAASKVIRYYDIAKDNIQSVMATLETPPAGYATDRVVADHNRDTGTANISQYLENTQIWDDVGTSGLKMGYRQPQVDAEVIDVTWQRIRKADINTALEFLKNNPFVANYAVVDVSHNDSGGGYADITQRLHAVSVKNYTVQVRFKDADSERRTIVYPHRTDDPNPVPPNGYLRVTSQESAYDETLQSYTYEFVRQGTSSFDVDTAWPDSDAERIVRRYFNRSYDPSPSTPSGYYKSTTESANAETGVGIYSYVYLKIGTSYYDRTSLHPDAGDAREITRIYHNRTSLPDASISGYRLVKRDISGAERGIQDYIFHFVEIGAHSYIVAKRIGLDGPNAPITYTEVYPRRLTDPAPEAPEGYVLADYDTDERGQGFADYKYQWAAENSAVTKPGEEGDIVGEITPHGNQQRTTIKLFRNLSWQDAKALVQSLKTVARTMSAVARPDGAGANVEWRYSNKPDDYTTKKRQTVYRHTESYTLSGDYLSEKTKYAVTEEVTDTVNTLFFDTLAEAEVAAAALSLGVKDSATTMRLNDGTALVQHVNHNVNQITTTELYKITA